jgi:hypothetical protein
LVHWAALWTAAGAEVLAIFGLAFGLAFGAPVELGVGVAEGGGV